MTDNQKATGLRALIVGASSGIGRELARQLAGCGGRVVACARQREGVVNDAGIAELICDVRDPLQCESVVAEASRHMGGIDAVVYCAGLSQLTPLDCSGVEEWQNVFATNMFGAASVARAALPHLCAAQSQGRAMFLTSDAAELAYPGLVAYSASKAALSRFCQGLSAEFPQLKVSEVIIGPTAGTGVADDFDPVELGKWVTRWFDEGYIRYDVRQPDEVAAQILDALLMKDPPSRLHTTTPAPQSAPLSDEG